MRVPPLDPPDLHYLLAASGWMGLGNLPEAEAELNGIQAQFQDHPDVLELRWALCAERRDWVTALPLATRLVEADPDRSSGWLHQAYALRRVPQGGLRAAWDALLPAFALFPKESIISYNLACYACQLGRLDDARQWLKKALKVGDKERTRAMALADPDLQPLWPELGKAGDKKA
jgi:tetratricopeptide (TPR) repeat protein